MKSSPNRGWLVYIISAVPWPLQGSAGGKSLDTFEATLMFYGDGSKLLLHMMIYHILSHMTTRFGVIDGNSYVHEPAKKLRGSIWVPGV